MEKLLLKHLNGEPIGRLPVWMMRQAGRYLPRYQEIRKGHTFWEMVLDPDLATQVTLTPLHYFDVDGIILFSDILTLPFGMGVPIDMQENIGPVNTQPFRTLIDFSMFESYRAGEHTVFVGEALKKIVSSISKDKTMLGFAGAPWTVATYLIEGKMNKTFKNSLAWMYERPEEFATALQHLANATAKYLVYQTQCGADVVQLFDTWASEMPRWFFQNYYRGILESIFKAVHAEGKKIIYFAKHAYHISDLLVELSMDVLSVDSLWSLEKWDETLQGRCSLQGNLDPILLFTTPEKVRLETRLLVQQAMKLKKPAILNLGHGILPLTPVENVKAFVEEAQTLWT